VTGPDAASDDPTAGGEATGVGGTPVPVDLSSDRRARRIWALFVAGPVIWLTHFGVVYLVAEAGCTGDGPGLRVFDPPVPTIVTGVTTVLAVVASAIVVWRGYVGWRRGASAEERLADVPGEHPEDDEHAGRLAFIALLLGGLSAIGVLFTAAPALVFVC
jgi:TRAP-type C4-dicarboxylate transport system permease small subunit